jgi:hypothetical protein
MEKLRKFALEKNIEIFDSSLKNKNFNKTTCFIKVNTKGVLKKIQKIGCCDTMFEISKDLDKLEIYKAFIDCNMQPVWLSDTTFECSICETHLEKTFKNFICPMCLKRYKNEKGMQNHIRNAHASL